MDPATLLEQVHAAMGGARLDRLAGVQISGRYLLGGLPGTFQQTIDFRQGRDVLRYDVGVTRGEEASGRSFSWWVDEKGLVNVDGTPAVLAEAATESYEDRNGWLYPDASVPSAYLGVEAQDGRQFELVRLQPPGGRTLTLWIDQRTHLPDRVVERDIEQQDDTTYFSDYRRVQGVWYPFQQRESTGDPRTDVIAQVGSLHWLGAVDAALFIPPRARNALAPLPADGAAITVPFSLHDGMILVMASLDGKAPVPFVLDSGGMNSVTPATAARLGLQLLGNFALNGVGAGVVDVQLAHAAHLQLGALELEDQPFLVVPLPPTLTYRGRAPPVAGLIGYELFRRLQVTIDYQHRLLTMRNPGSAVPGTRVALAFEGRRPFVRASVDGTPGYFGVDTGDDGALTVFRHFYLAHAFPIQAPGIDSGQSGVGGYAPTLLTRVSSFTMGDLTLADPLAQLNFANAGAFASDFNAGNIGAQVLQNFIVTFDYANRALYLRPAAQFGAAMAYNRSGLQFDVNDAGALVISSVTAGSPGASSGLEAGDQLLAVDQRAESDQDYSLVEDQFRQAAGTRLQVQVLRHGKRRQALLTLRELLPPEGCCHALLGRPPPSPSGAQQAAAMQ